MVKTNVMRVLDKEKIAYEPFSYSPELTEGVKIVEVLGEDPACVFKTLVTESGDREHFVFVIPVAETLDLKAVSYTHLDVYKRQIHNRFARSHKLRYGAP